MKVQKILLLLLLLLNVDIYSQSVNSPKVLIVVAHPDDEATFAATTYKITHALNGIVELALITNGEGGFRYSTLAESIYGLELTNEEIGRKHLPEIRKKELMNAGKITGISNYYFFEQKDHKYTLNIREVLDSVWNVVYVKNKLKEIMRDRRFDYIFVLTPTTTTHAHHSTAGILTLEAVKELDIKDKPVVLGGMVSSKTDTVRFNYRGHSEFPITSISESNPTFSFDRTQKFGFNDALDYKIIVNWEIAEHKSQGTMQQLYNRGDYEDYYWFDMNDKSKMEKTRDLFEKMKVNHFQKKEYK